MALRVAFTLGALVIGWAGSAAAQDGRADVLRALQAFTDGIRAKDTVAIADLIDSAARFTLTRPIAGGGGSRVMAMTTSDFIRAAVRADAPAIDEVIRNPIVQIDGDLAAVWAEYQVRIDGKVSHCGLDAFHLFRSGGRWRILHVSDTFKRDGCGAPWPK